jgi:dTDP-4-dehydrorhamnose 3,5-epimerase
VKFAHLSAFSDERGSFLETFRREWFPERSWDAVQANRSDSKAGVLRGLHYHFKQIDYWYLAAGRIRVGLADLRTGSPTRGGVQVLEVSEDDPVGIFVPVGVAHGFYAVTDCTLTYLVDQYYDNSDEFGVAWNDPDLQVNWGTDAPILSPRDQQNPLLRDIPEDELPG